MLRLCRSAGQAVALLAMLGVIAIWGLYESAGRSPRSEPNLTARASDLSGDAQIAFEGSVILTESPSNQSSTIKILRVRKSAADAIATDRSGLTTDGPNIISLTPGEDPFGGGADAISPAIPSTKKAYVRTAPSGTYRTLCVRLCDGYYWPVSFSTTSDGLGDDKEKCESSCGVPVKLYYYRNPDGQPEDAVDLKGEPYMQLANAFRYRNEYVSQCKCQPDPWEAASLDRHKQYAVLAQEGKLALYDNRKPQKRRKNRDNVQVIAVSEGGMPVLDVTADPATKTTISSTKKSKRKTSLVVRKKDSNQVSFGAAMGITKVGQSSSGKKYSARKAAPMEFDKRK
ncbi:MAG: DUF2865 domain-containing protein [Hyphomicrobiaceae bacterium]